MNSLQGKFHLYQLVHLRASFSKYAEYFGIGYPGEIGVGLADSLEVGKDGKADGLVREAGYIPKGVGRSHRDGADEFLREFSVEGY